MSHDHWGPSSEFLVLGQVTLNSVEIQVTGKCSTGHFNQMTVTNSRRFFMSGYVSKHLGDCWFKCKQKTPISEPFWSPKTSRQNHPSSIMLLGIYHSTSYPVWKAFPTKLARVTMNLKQNHWQSCPASKVPWLSCTCICSALHRKADEKRKSHSSLGCEASPCHKSLPLTCNRLGEPNSHWISFAV